MSYDGIGDKDLTLKLRMMNLLWNLGWFVRPNVKIVRYQEGRRTSYQFTDIDVLATKILPLQDPIIAICSAKSGKESDSAELFWLSGVKSYFGASFAYYIRTKANISKVKTLCEKLGIIALNDEQLSIIEERFSVRFMESQYFSFDTYQQMYKYFAELKEKRVSLYNYIAEKFWIDPMNRQLLRIITAIKDVNVLKLSAECEVFMKYYLTSLLALPIYKFSHLLMQIPTSMIETEFETALMGGEFAREEKEKIIQAVRSFLSEFAKTARLPEGFASNIDSVFQQISKLEYSKDMSDLLINMVQNYRYSPYTPRMLDALIFQMVKKPGMIPDIRYVTLPDLSKDQWEYTAKLTKDILIFVQRVGGLKRSEIII